MLLLAALRRGAEVGTGRKWGLKRSWPFEECWCYDPLCPVTRRGGRRCQRQPLSTGALPGCRVSLDTLLVAGRHRWHDNSGSSQTLWCITATTLRLHTATTTAAKHWLRSVTLLSGPWPQITSSIISLPRVDTSINIWYLLIITITNSCYGLKAVLQCFKCILEFKKGMGLVFLK